MRQPGPARDWRGTPEEASGLINRITGDAVEWITLRDAFLYVWKRLKNSKNAQSALRERLEAGEIGARAEMLEKFDLTARLLNSEWTDDATTEPPETFRREIIVPKFWARATVDYSGRDFAQSVAAAYLFKVHGITVRRDDIFRIWPLPEPPIESKVPTEPEVDAKLAQQPPSTAKRGGRRHSAKSRVIPRELVNFLKATFDGQMTVPRVRSLAEQRFGDIAEPKWRAALDKLREMPGNKILGKGDTRRTRAKRDRTKPTR